MPGRPGTAVGLLAVLLAVLLVSMACGPAGPAPTRETPGTGEPGVLRVVTTMTVLADLVAQVGGHRVEVESLVPKGGEVHTFDPTPSDVRRIASADVVLGNGLGLDAWLEALVRDAGTSAPVILLAEGLDGATYLGDASGQGPNPHLWLDVGHAMRYVGRIRDALVAADPAGTAGYDVNAEAYRARLAALDAEVRGRIDAVPAADRRVVSFHDVFPYFAAAYGLEVVGTIIDAPGQDPSAGEIARLIQLVRRRGARAVLAEAQFSPDLARTIAAETGAVIVADLLTESLGDPPADSYEGLIRWDVDRIVEGLTEG